MDPRTAQYWRALRWYPAEWRVQHGAALVGDLMDQDDAHGRARPSKGERGALIAAGLKARLASRGEPSSPQWLLRVVGFVGSLALCTWYAAVSPVSLAPAGSGFIGPTYPPGLLSNGSILPAVLLACAVAATFAKREPLARAFGGAAAIAALVATEFATGRLIGPDAPMGAMLFAFGLMSAAPVRRWSAAVGFLAGCVAIALVELSLAGRSSSALLSSIAWFAFAGAIATRTAISRRRQRPE